MWMVEIKTKIFSEVYNNNQMFLFVFCFCFLNWTISLFFLFFFSQWEERKFWGEHFKEGKAEMQ